MGKRNLERDCSGQVIIVSALLVAVLLLSTALYVIEVGKQIPIVDATETNVFSGYQQSARSTLISALANATGGGNMDVLGADLAELKTVILSNSYQTMLRMDYSTLNSSGYQNGLKISWGADGKGISGAYVTLILGASSPSTTSNLEYTENVTSALNFNGNYQQLAQQEALALNGVWTEPGTDLSSTNCAHYISHGIAEVYMQTGYWTDSNTITLYDASGINTAITNAHNAGLKIYAWITSQTSEGGTIDVSTSGKRTTAITSIVSLLSTYNFDGIADDVEDWDWSSFNNLISYFNGATIAMHSEGKSYFTATFMGWVEMMEAEAPGKFGTIIADRILPMMYGGYPTGETQFKQYVDEALTWAGSPISFAIHSDGAYPYSLQDCMDWITEQLPSSPATYLSGFNIFWASGMTSTQWIEWDNWTTKDSFSMTQPPIYTPSNDKTKQVNLKINVSNEGKETLARNFALSYQNATKWIAVDSPSITNFGNGTYTVAFTAETSQINEPLVVKVICQDQRGIFVGATLTCTNT